MGGWCRSLGPVPVPVHVPSKLIEKVARGENVIIARHGRPVARLTRLTEGKKPVRFGVLEGQVSVADDFDAAIPDEIIAHFEGR